ncbi:hypothetical protein BDN70DRAFT_287057 [Pholiota conissans]|uniref:Uncharacterized protein n=1 Tax=Pholiota conissans TaxID=109636 RepID=A0A9P5YW01_9AGAR|nr:hypothetical protein BDN70DRAFT_287057 [Pholiota conissans]
MKDKQRRMGMVLDHSHPSLVPRSARPSPCPALCPSPYPSFISLSQPASFPSSIRCVFIVVARGTIRPHPFLEWRDGSGGMAAAGHHRREASLRWQSWSSSPWLRRRIRPWVTIVPFRWLVVVPRRLTVVIPHPLVVVLRPLVVRVVVPHRRSWSLSYSTVVRHCESPPRRHPSPSSLNVHFSHFHHPPTLFAQVRRRYRSLPAVVLSLSLSSSIGCRIAIQMKGPHPSLEGRGRSMLQEMPATSLRRGE